MQEKRRITGLAELQFVCCCMIVLRHSNPLNSLGINISLLSGQMERVAYSSIEFVTHITEAAVPLFFFISGYLFFNNFKNVDDYTKKIKTRIKSIVVPYFIWSFLNWSFFAVITHVPVFSGKMNMKPVEMNIGSVLRDVTMSNYAPLWFLRVLFCLCLLGFAINKILEHKSIAIVLIVSLVVWNVVKGYEYHSVLAWLPFFAGGGYLRKYDVKLSTHKNISVIMLAAGFALLLSSYIQGENIVGQTLYLARLVVAVSVFSLFYSRQSQEKWYWGASMFVYCTHFAIVSAIEKIMFIVLGKTIWTGLISFVLVPFGVIFMLVHVALFISARMPNIWKVIAGGRNLNVNS